jgi:SAM-dependent methyltransferase
MRNRRFLSNLAEAVEKAPVASIVPSHGASNTLITLTGFDTLLAARWVGASGRAIGVDMTPGMIARARSNAAALGLENIEFLLGAIERLSLPDASVDLAIFSCWHASSKQTTRYLDSCGRGQRAGVAGVRG